MDPYIISTIGLLILILLLVMGTHVGIALTISGFIGLCLLQGFEKALVTTVSSFYGKVSATSLVTLPLFILVGFLASGGGISRDIYKSLDLLIGRFRSGLGIATVIGCTAFGTVCGSSLVTAAVFAKISAPEMRKRGYSKSFAYGICAASGSIGMLIPPSILAIVYGMLSGISIGKILIAGIIPGLLWAILFILTILLIGKIKSSWIQYPEKVPLASWKQRITSLIWWWPVFVSGGIIFGGIYGGVFTPTESAAVAAFILFVFYLYRGIFKRSRVTLFQRFRELYEMLMETATTSAMIFFVLGSATIFSNFAVLAGLTNRFSDFVMSLGLSPLQIVIIFCLVYIVMGCFLDSISMLCMTISIFNPIIEKMGVDPIWYAVIIILSIEIGFITPPFGVNIFSVLGVAEKDVDIKDIVVGSFPFLIAEFISLVIIFSFPGLSTFLPSFVH